MSAGNANSVATVQGDSPSWATQLWNWITIPDYAGPDTSGQETQEDIDTDNSTGLAQSVNQFSDSTGALASSILPSTGTVWLYIIAAIIILFLVAYIARETVG